MKQKESIAPPSRRRMIEAGIRTAATRMVQQDMIWSKYSNDKVDIGERLAGVIRTLSAASPLDRKLRALSIGSSNEPQFRLLETAFRGGLFLFDIDRKALDRIDERIRRQHTEHVVTIQGDYTEAMLDEHHARAFFQGPLKRRKVDLITLHHSLYYCGESSWMILFENLYRHLLARTGAMHAVMMAAGSDDRMTTTWLYNHFAGRYFGVRNDQSLPALKKELEANELFRDAQILLAPSTVKFFVDDFEKFMEVVWMILLYPDVHRYSEEQIEEIVTFVYDRFWCDRQPLLQLQHHLVLYRGIGFRGLL